MSNIRLIPDKNKAYHEDIYPPQIWRLVKILRMRGYRVSISATALPTDSPSCAWCCQLDRKRDGGSACGSSPWDAVSNAAVLVAKIAKR